MSAVDDSDWKLGEYERHFNVIQAGIRGLASVWLLAAFGAIATLLKRDQVNSLWIPTEWVIVSVCAMGAVGLALLWIIDQLVYHRLLNALFIVGLKLEYDQHRLASDQRNRPPIHASMLASSPAVGYARLLSLFYLLPVGALGAVSIGAAVHALSGTHEGRDWAMLALVAVPAVAVVGIALRGGRERGFFKSQAAYFGEPEFTKLFGAKPGAGMFHTLLGSEPLPPAVNGDAVTRTQDRDG